MNKVLNVLVATLLLTMVALPAEASVLHKFAVVVKAPFIMAKDITLGVIGGTIGGVLELMWDWDQTSPQAKNKSTSDKPSAAR